MIALFTGTRTIPRKVARERIDEVAEFIGERETAITHVIAGGDEDGVDGCAIAWAKQNYIPYTVFVANWKAQGKAAGPIRNKAMVNFAKRIGCRMAVAIWDGESRGTSGTIDLASKAGIGVLVNRLGVEAYTYVRPFEDDQYSLV